MAYAAATEVVPSPLLLVLMIAKGVRCVQLHCTAARGMRALRARRARADAPVGPAATGAAQPSDCHLPVLELHMANMMSAVRTCTPPLPQPAHAREIEAADGAYVVAGLHGQVEDVRARCGHIGAAVEAVTVQIVLQARVLIIRLPRDRLRARARTSEISKRSVSMSPWSDGTQLRMAEAAYCVAVSVTAVSFDEIALGICGFTHTHRAERAASPSHSFC